MSDLDLAKGCLTKPSAIYTDWHAAPKDPDNILGPKQRVRRMWVVGKGLSLAWLTERLNLNVPDKPIDCRITWEELAIFNWGTAIPAEINWYLRECLPHCIERTHDRQNYMFKGKPDARFLTAQTGPVPFIWVPEYLPLPAPPSGPDRTDSAEHVGLAGLSVPPQRRLAVYAGRLLRSDLQGGAARRVSVTREP